MDTVDLYSNQLLPMPHPHGSVAPPSHHSPLPPLSSALTVPNSSSSQGKKSMYILPKLALSTSDMDTREKFYFGNFKLLGMGRQIGLKNFGSIWSIVSQFISTHSGTLSPNISTTPITAMGCQQCLPLSVV